MNRRHYERPATTVFEIHCQVHLMGLSRNNYGLGGSGFGDGGMGVRPVRKQ